jgi:type I restriction enzyme M protein
MDSQTHNQIVSFIWGIADDCLRDVYVRGKYRDVILPMTVIRRLDAVLEDTKASVLDLKKKLDAAGIKEQSAALCNAAGQSFCNWSPFRLKDLTNRATPQKLKTDIIAYLDGFSPNVQEILEKFKFRNQIDTMIDAGILGSVIEKFVDPRLGVTQLDNHAMGTVFEELIRRFNEENNEEAGEHFTPRDVVELMADLIFKPIADQIKDATYTVYDGASGTGGMLTVSQDRLLELSRRNGRTVSIHLFGQEINPETYAITKADMLLKGEGAEAENIAYGSTLSSDGFPSRQFDFMLSNPPYGKSWKNDAEKLGGKKGIADPRFVTSFAGEPEYGMIPRVSDGQLLFLLNNASKMKETTELGSRIAEVHNGSSLFTGDAGGGESNARRYLIERDLVEAIIALPENMFYNTGIGTFIWVLSNRKEARRRGKIQLINATGLKSPLRKNLGKKNCEFSPNIRHQIMDLFLAFENNEYSKIFDNSAFGYWKVTVLRPQLGADCKPLRDKKGKPVKGESDTEQIPLDYPGGIDAFIKAEVLPYAPDAWVDEGKTQIGYEISFTKHFYKPVQLRELADIVADIRALERETDGLLEEVLG